MLEEYELLMIKALKESAKPLTPGQVARRILHAKYTPNFVQSVLFRLAKNGIVKADEENHEAFKPWKFYVN